MHTSRQASKPPAVIAAMLAVVVVASSAVAKPPDSAASSESLVQKGIELRRLGEDARALEVFVEAASLAPDSARLMAHLGTCHQALGNWVKSDEFLRKALERGTDPYIQRHRAALERALEVVATRVGRLQISGGPEGAEIYLNGNRVGQLPLQEPIRARVGNYTLEVRRPGHYAANRPVTIKSDQLIRESVNLTAIDEPASAGPGGATRLSHDSTGNPDWQGQASDRPRAPAWLPWTLAGLGGAAALTAGVALVVREGHASRWNDDARCWNVVGETRSDRCGDERDAAQSAQTVAAVGGISAVLLGVTAVVIGLRDRDTREETSAGLSGCTFGPSAAQCSGRF